MAGDRLPSELLAENLSRVPVQSLLRFRTTSKSFRSLIDSQHFINLHLKNSLSRSLIILHNSEIYQLQIDNPTKSTMIPLNHPLPRRDNSVSLIGSCNGLLSISHGQMAFLYPPNTKIQITFFNPNTRKHQIIPFLPLPISNVKNNARNPNRSPMCLCVHGFGFDPLTGDYKLIRIVWFVSLQNDFYGSHVRLFSSKTNSWKEISTMPYFPHYVQNTGVFVENSIHWIMAGKIGGLVPLIAAFNVTLEIFNEVPLPAELGSKGKKRKGKKRESFKIDVAVLGGCLCMTVNYKTTKIDVWVMKEYGSRDSWCKLFTLVKSSFTSPLKSSRPLGYSCDGSKVLLEGIQDLLEVSHNKLFWFDLKSEQVSFVEGIPNFNGAMICVESLVPPSFSVDNCGRRIGQKRAREGTSSCPEDLN